MTVTLFREIDALGGTGMPAEGESWSRGYSEALSDVLSILTKRGFTEHADPHSARYAAAEGLWDRLRSLAVQYDGPGHEKLVKALRDSANLMAEPAIDKTTWAYKDGVRAFNSDEPRDSNPCDLEKEAARARQWFAGFDDAEEGSGLDPRTPAYGVGR